MPEAQPKRRETRMAAEAPEVPPKTTNSGGGGKTEVGIMPSPPRSPLPCVLPPLSSLPLPAFPSRPTPARAPNFTPCPYLNPDPNPEPQPQP